MQWQYMVRNLQTQISLPLKPLRCCQNKIGPGESSLTASAHTSIIGLSSSRSAVANARSSIRLKHRASLDLLASGRSNARTFSWNNDLFCIAHPMFEIRQETANIIPEL